MAKRVSSMKKMRALHKRLGGRRNGYYLVRFERDIDTNKVIRIDQTIATHIKPTANWYTKLVKGELRKYR